MSGPGTGDSTGSPADTGSGSSTESDSGGSVPVCGDGVVEGDEVCESTDLNGESCVSLGFGGGVIGCQVTCEDYDVLGCSVCGDAMVETGEDCEGEVPQGVSCDSLGFEEGEVVCGKDCQFDTTGCSICGDGVQRGPEQCDGVDFGGETCASLGFDGGVLGCDIKQCAYDYTACMGGQYVQDFEASLVMPPEFSLSIIDPWIVDNVHPINGSNSARSGPLVAGGITNLTLNASFPAAGSVSFVHEESSAAGVDQLEFRVDGILSMAWSGVNAPVLLMEAVPAGDHIFEWRFNRQGFINEGLDAVFVDDITLAGGVPL